MDNNNKNNDKKFFYKKIIMNNNNIDNYNDNNNNNYSNRKMITVVAIMKIKLYILRNKQKNVLFSSAYFLVLVTHNQAHLTPNQNLNRYLSYCNSKSFFLFLFSRCRRMFRNKRK